MSSANEVLFLLSQSVYFLFPFLVLFHYPRFPGSCQKAVLSQAQQHVPVSPAGQVAEMGGMGVEGQPGKGGESLSQ